MQYYLLYKPFQVLSQFTSTDGKLCLKDIIEVEKDVYPVGRLDYDSEGLLLLTNDKKINHQLLHPSFEHKRTYWVQVDGAITQEAIQQLSKGVTISVDGTFYSTKPASVHVLPDTIEVPERNPPIRYRKAIPTSWASITLIEGKNRQVRKMFASVGFPVLRLIRAQMGTYSIDKMQPGDLIHLSEGEVQEGFFL
ncbi:MAG: pseudouridine synthase [Chitinophagaceae bacterium]